MRENREKKQEKSSSETKAIEYVSEFRTQAMKY